MRLSCLSHTALECSRRRYSVLREAPEEENEHNDRRRTQATEGLTAPSSTVTSRGDWSETCERGTGHQELNTQDVIHRVEGKPEDTEGFAIKLMEHKRGSGILPRGTWTRDMDKGLCQGRRQVG